MVNDYKNKNDDEQKDRCNVDFFKVMMVMRRDNKDKN